MYVQRPDEPDGPSWLEFSFGLAKTAWVVLTEIYGVAIDAKLEFEFGNQELMVSCPKCGDVFDGAKPEHMSAEAMEDFNSDKPLLVKCLKCDHVFDGLASLIAEE